MYTVLKGRRVQDLELALAPSKKTAFGSAALMNNKNRHDIPSARENWLRLLAVEDDGEDEIRRIIECMTAEAPGDRPTAARVHECLQKKTPKESTFCGPCCRTRRWSDSSEIGLDFPSSSTDLAIRPKDQQVLHDE